jgi:hypothetical protein
MFYPKGRVPDTNEREFVGAILSELCGLLRQPSASSASSAVQPKSREACRKAGQMPTDADQKMNSTVDLGLGRTAVRKCKFQTVLPHPCPLPLVEGESSSDGSLRPGLICVNSHKGRVPSGKRPSPYFAVLRPTSAPPPMACTECPALPFLRGIRVKMSASFILSFQKRCLCFARLCH